MLGCTAHQGHQHPPDPEDCGVTMFRWHQYWHKRYSIKGFMLAAKKVMVQNMPCASLTNATGICLTAFQQMDFSSTQRERNNCEKNIFQDLTDPRPQWQKRKRLVIKPITKVGLILNSVTAAARCQMM